MSEVVNRVEIWLKIQDYLRTEFKSTPEQEEHLVHLIRCYSRVGTPYEFMNEAELNSLASPVVQPEEL
jgi:hypothetical protein